MFQTVNKICFFNCYLATPQPTLGNYWGVSLTHLVLITVLLHIWPKVRFELQAFQFRLQHLNLQTFSHSVFRHSRFEQIDLKLSNSFEWWPFRPYIRETFINKNYETMVHNVFFTDHDVICFQIKTN